MKKLFLWLTWLFTVSVSIYFTIDGLSLSYPTPPVLYGLSSTQLLGLALCCAQYALLHVGFLLVENRTFRLRSTGIAALIFGVVLTISNVSFAYTSISKNNVSVEVEEVSSGNMTEFYRDQIESLTKKNVDLQEQINSIPPTHSTNRNRMAEKVTPQIERNQEKIESYAAKLEAELLKGSELNQRVSETSRLDGSWISNLTGWDPYVVLAWTLAGSLDPASVLLMMTLTGFFSHKRYETREKPQLMDLWKRIRQSKPDSGTVEANLHPKESSVYVSEGSSVKVSEYTIPSK